MNIRLDRKRVLVTGGNSGIGATIALGLAAAGSKKVAKHKRGEALPIQADVSDPKAVAELFRQIDAAWSEIGILINNTGIDGARALGWEANVTAWRKVVEVNLFGAFYCARESLKRMVPQKNDVVLSTTSMHEEIASSGYSATPRTQFQGFMFAQSKPYSQMLDWSARSPVKSVNPGIPAT